MKTPRSGATSVALALLFIIGVTSMAAAKTFVYVSNAQDGNIDSYIMDTSTGALTPIGKAEAAKLVMPMTVSPSKKQLYAVIRSQPTRVLTYAIDPATGALTQKASAPLPDSMPYVSTDHTGRYLFTASYGGDKLAVSPIGENGLVEAEAIQVIATGRNAHAILPDRSNKFVYATILSANQVLQFIFDSKTGKLTANEPAAVSPEAGHGPRHMTLSPDNKNLYVLNELSGHVTQYAIDTAKGTLTLVESISSVPAEAGLVWGAPQAPAGAAPAPAAAAPKDDKPKVWAADIQTTPNGKFLYSTERTSNKIALFTVTAETGKLTYVTNFATEAQPRGIKIDPSGQYLVASGEKSDRLSVYKIDQSTGKLGEPSRYPVGNGANWVEIVDVP
ncbi:6-phosphogluconolactonase [Bradyrhizobium sp. AZCC 1610]|uniref:lactonase family protein n=1 Tax=Bradyrhizobium sp. AZCC 1610 TaxID=3117020 RepID=UPI002FF02A1E